MLLAAQQMQSHPSDVAANLDRLDKAAAEAAAGGARLLVTPELGLVGYGAGPDLPLLAEPADGPLAESLVAIARRHSLAVVAGFAERDGDAIYNSALFVSIDQRAVYRKSHLYGAYEKRWFRAAAPSTVLVRHDGLSFGLLICYDVEFPENVRRLALAGADAVLVPTALPAGESGDFIAAHMIAVRAFENQTFVAYVDNCGKDGDFDYAGLSRIAAPDGTILAAPPGRDETLLFANIAPSAYARSRAENTYLADLKT
ncbi:carbon-nitrogen hydrolase family protein [Pleomorphomonas sp. JP5]|uniref:carbon-nitrogen hydrolase family protein n=1 Tax=Pleomorphomonas sp. JP5 TaxID=2942998 RepID=UPI00204450F3|nr:carbon-nitrogen hydrolase family protein [Pleomorphomonas sp. JP5]MCM5559718.1 carbon-nitrogen hydrolase family protein [Pleomorphomonas sp. JP5]